MGIYTSLYDVCCALFKSGDYLGPLSLCIDARAEKLVISRVIQSHLVQSETQGIPYLDLGFSVLAQLFDFFLISLIFFLIYFPLSIYNVLYLK
jgi:hypothetical protein